MGTETLQQVHDNMLSSRAKAVAHSDLEERKIMIAPPGAKIGKTDMKAGGLSIIVSKRVFSAKYIRQIRSLCGLVGSAIDKATEALKYELYKGRILPAEVFELNCENDD